MLNSAKYVRHLQKRVQTERLNDATCNSTVVKDLVSSWVSSTSQAWTGDAQQRADFVAFSYCVICHTHPFTVLPDLNLLSQGLGRRAGQGGVRKKKKKAVFRKIHVSNAWLKQAGPEKTLHRVAPHDEMQPKQQAIGFLPGKNIHVIKNKKKKLNKNNLLSKEKE